MKKNQRKSVLIIAVCLIVLTGFALNAQIANAEQNTAMAGYTSDCKSMPEKISLIDAGSDVSKACVFFSSKTFTLNFPAYCNPVDIYFAILNPDNKLIFINSRGRMSLDFTPYAAGANSSINTSFSVANSSLAAEIYGKCVIYWFIASANGGDILKSIESERYELGWYNTDDAVIPPAGSSKVPDTGVTKCYNDTEEIPCPSEGEDFYGQDGNYSINPMSYTKLDDNGNDLPITATSWAMVRDNVTGLIWENKNSMDGTENYTNPHDADNTYTWYDSNPATNGGYAGYAGNGTDTEDFIKALNDSNFGGHSDWRLPTIKELSTIVDYSIPYPGPTIDTNYFKDIIMYFYWSSTTYSGVTTNAWGVHFYYDYGYDHYRNKHNDYYVRAVRGGQSVIGLFDNLVINGNGTVTDSSTGLMWQQDTFDNRITWNEALSYCQNLDLGGYTDWRLPTIKELRSIIDYSRYNLAIDTNIFNDTFMSFYWSSTTGSYYTYDAWGVNFSLGDYYYGSKLYGYYVRAVRGGQ